MKLIPLFLLIFCVGCLSWDELYPQQSYIRHHHCTFKQVAPGYMWNDHVRARVLHGEGKMYTCDGLENPLFIGEGEEQP